MFKQRSISPGVSRTPKVECATDSSTIGAGTYTQDRIYLFPIPRGSYITFDTYCCDFVLASRPNIDFKWGIYERTGAVLSPTGYQLVAGTTVTVTGQTTSFQTTALGATKTLPPGHYCIAFLFDEKGSTLISSPNAHPLNTFIRGDWISITAGSFTLPQDFAGLGVTYTMATNNECPFWCGLSYTGDVIP